jgi:antitoxin VapB
VGAERHVKLFRNGRNQAVRIPREFELPGEEAIMRKEGERLIIEPAARGRTLREAIEYLRSLPPLGSEDRFPEIDDLPAEPFEL